MYRRTKKKLSLPGPDDTMRQTLPNGITVLVRENFASPAVVVNGYVLVGSEDETPATCGLAGFTTSVMERGTHSRPFTALYEEVETIGASFGFSSGAHITSFGAKGLAESLPLLLDILNDVLRNPAFRMEQVERARAEILTAIQERGHSTRQMAARRFHKALYPKNHPYHWSTLGYAETIQPLTQNDLINFHAQYVSPQDMVIVIVGAIATEDAVEAVTKVFGDWDANRPARAPLPDVPALTERRETRIALPDKTQSDLRLGWLGPNRVHEDYIICHVGNTVLGVFGLHGRLGERVRKQNGLAYYAYSVVEGGYGPGAWYATAGVNPANVDKAVEMLLDEVRRFQDTLIPKDELEDSKSYLTGSLPLRLETNEGVALTLFNLERYGLGLDYVQKYADIIKAIQPYQVRTIAQRWLNAENYVLSVAEPETS